MEISSIIIFGDDYGIPQLIPKLDLSIIKAVFCAEIRPQQHTFLFDYCKNKNLPIYIQPKFTSPSFPEFLELVSMIKPDLILSHSYSMHIPEIILNIPKFGAINIHGALLPQYRGPNPIQWALINNERMTGVTAHYMTTEFDKGPIVGQKFVPINFTDTWLDIQKNISNATEKLLNEIIPELINTGLLPSNQQNETIAHHYHRRHPDDGYIDIKNEPVILLYNKIRALVTPHPGVFYYQNNDKIVINTYQSLYAVINLKYGGGEMRSDSILLSPIREQDSELLLTWINSREDVLLSSNYKPVSFSTHTEWFESIQKDPTTVIFGIRLVSDDSLIGTCKITNIHWIHRSAEVQIKISDPNQRNKGYGTESLSLLINFAFSDLNLNRLYLHVFTSNTPAIKLYEKVGFSYEGTLRSGAFINNTYLDIKIMGLLRNEWEKKSNNRNSSA